MYIQQHFTVYDIQFTEDP